MVENTCGGCRFYRDVEECIDLGISRLKGEMGCCFFNPPVFFAVNGKVKLSLAVDTKDTRPACRNYSRKAPKLERTIQ